MAHLASCATQDFYNRDTYDMNNAQSRSLPSLSLNFLSADLTWLDTYILLSPIESLPYQWRNTIKPQQMMLWTSQYSELAH